MRYRAWLVALLLLSACSSGSSQSVSLVLVNRYWEHVNVEAVMTKSADCENRDARHGSPQQFVLAKGQSHRIDAPNGETICWRHDPNPNNPVKDLWSGWSKAVLFPGQSAETDL
jgi:hypothetical protein